MAGATPNLESSCEIHCDHQQRVRGVRKTPASLCVKTPSLTPLLFSVNATLANLDLNGFRFRLHGFRKMHVKHPVFEIRGHLAPIRILRK